MRLSLFLAVLLGYLVGSVPFAYLLVRRAARLDIRKHGSGNVGALNSLQVTGSRAVGAAVLLLDLVKGIVAVWLARVLWGLDFPAVAASGLGAVAGHNFPAWLRFRGGRGLATAAGAMLVTGWGVVAAWGLCWLAAFRIGHEVNIANAAATLLCLCAILAVPDTALQWLPEGTPTDGFRVFGALVLVLVLVKLVEPVLTYFQKRV